MLYGMVFSITQWAPHHHIHNKLDLRGAQGYFSGLRRHGRVWRVTGAPRCLSAHHRRVVRSLVGVEIEICDLSTVGDVVMDLILHLNFENSTECGHLSIRTRMPDSALSETMLTSSLRKIVNLCGGSLELHGVLS